MKTPWGAPKPEPQGRLPTRPVCPTCRARSDGYTDPDFDGSTPKPGDVALCICCGALAVYTAELLLEAPDETEAVLLEAEPQVRALRRKRAAAIIDAAAAGDIAITGARLALKAALR